MISIIIIIIFIFIIIIIIIIVIIIIIMSVEYHNPNINRSFCTSLLCSKFTVWSICCRRQRQRPTKKFN